MGVWAHLTRHSFFCFARGRGQTERPFPEGTRRIRPYNKFQIHMHWCARDLQNLEFPGPPDGIPNFEFWLMNSTLAPVRGDHGGHAVQALGSSASPMLPFLEALLPSDRLA